MKIIVPFRFNPMRNTKYQKNRKNKFNKLENTIMASFPAKIGWTRLRKRENKIIVLFCSYPKRNRKFQKNSEKKSKNYKIQLWLLLKPK